MYFLFVINKRGQLTKVKVFAEGINTCVDKDCILHLHMYIKPVSVDFFNRFVCYLNKNKATKTLKKTITKKEKNNNKPIEFGCFLSTLIALLIIIHIMVSHTYILSEHSCCSFPIEFRVNFNILTGKCTYTYVYW